jgi:hypothetical protein
MLRNLIAAFIGGLVTFLYLVIWNATNFTDPIPAFLGAAVLGGIGTYLWPFVVGIWFIRRAKSRRDEKIQQEVDKQLADRK